MNSITVELSDEALADLHAVRTALAMFVDGDWSVADLMPEA